MVAVTEAERQVVELRMAGYTLDHIASQLMCSKSTVHRRLDKYLKKVRAQNLTDAEQIINLSIERIDRMIRAVWAQARSGNLHAIDRVSRLEQQRLEILGLYAPKHQILDLPGRPGSRPPIEHKALTDDDVAREIAELIGPAAARAIAGNS